MKTKKKFWYAYLLVVWIHIFCQSKVKNIVLFSSQIIKALFLRNYYRHKKMLLWIVSHISAAFCLWNIFSGLAPSFGADRWLCLCYKIFAQRKSLIIFSLNWLLNTFLKDFSIKKKLLHHNLCPWIALDATKSTSMPNERSNDMY